MKITTTKCLLAFILALSSLQLTAQVHVDNQWKNIINPIFQNLDKSKIQSGILLDYAMEFTDVQAYNGVITDTTYIDANILGSIYKTLFMGKMVADTTHTPLFDKHAYNWARDRFNATKDSTGVYILSGLMYEYQTLDEDALAQNRITVSNNKYYDKFVGGVWQNPYNTKKTFALTPPLLHSRSRNVYFKLPSYLFVSNLDGQISSVEIDADNGQGYQNLPFNTAVPLTFNENKIHDLTFKLTLIDNSTLYCRSKFKVDDPVLKQPKQLARGSIPVSDERVYIYEDGNFFNAAWLTIRRRPDNVQSGNITRPLIIAEGLDTGNFTAPEDFGGDRTMADFQRDVNRGGNTLRDLIDEDRNHAYDLIYIDWVRGMADLRDNSRVLEEVLEWINAQKVPVNGITEQNVLLGQSMGGVIGRYTLARMENNNKPHDVRLFVAHDSPMQGANTPLSVQHFSAHMKEEYVSSPLIWINGEITIPIGYGLAQLGVDFLNFFGGNNDDVPAFVSPAQLLSLQDQTAARQLNYWSVFKNGGNNHAQTRNFNLSWQQTLENEGWPTQSRNIAISNGNECTVNHGFSPGAQFMDLDSRSNPGFLLDMLNAVLAPTVGVNLTDAGLIIVGSIPGRSRWETKFDFNSYGNQGAQNRIYRGRLRFEKKVLWIGPTIKYDVFNRSNYAPHAALPFDTYSGGDENFEDFEDDLPDLLPSIDFINPRYGFIPVVSALDIKKTNGNDPTPSDYLKSYSGGMPQDTNLESGFDAFIVDNQPDQPRNNEHISFQVRNGDWLAAELEANQPGNSFPVLPDCSFICTVDNIVGPEFLCSSGVYTINAPNGANVSWTLSNTNTASITSQSGGSVTLSASSGYREDVELTAIIDSPGCGASPPITFNIRVGKPDVPPSIFGPSTVNTGAIVNYTAGVTNGASSYEWRLPYPFTTASPLNYMSHDWQLEGPGTTRFARAVTGYSKKSGYVQVMGRNACGVGGAKLLYVQHATSGGGGSPGGGGIPRIDPEDNVIEVTLYPNPTKGKVTASLTELEEYEGEPPTVIYAIKILDQNQYERKFYQFKNHLRSQQMNVSYLNTGLNYLIIFTDTGTFTKKLIVY